jgi:hypothetical protein
MRLGALGILVLSTGGFFLFSCVGGNSAQPAGKSANEWQDRVRQEAAEQAEAYGIDLDVLLPEHLPQGLNPDADVFVITPEAVNPALIVSFAAQTERAGQMLWLEITTEPLGYLECPLCPDEGQVSTSVRGSQAVAEELEFRDDSVGYSLQFAVGDVFIDLTANWPVRGGSNTAPTDDMKEELLGVAESMFPSKE